MNVEFIMNYFPYCENEFSKVSIAPTFNFIFVAQLGFPIGNHITNLVHSLMLLFESHTYFYYLFL